MHLTSGTIPEPTLKPTSTSRNTRNHPGTSPEPIPEPLALRGTSLEPSLETALNLYVKISWELSPAMTELQGFICIYGDISGWGWRNML